MFSHKQSAKQCLFSQQGCKSMTDYFQQRNEDEIHIAVKMYASTRTQIFLCVCVCTMLVKKDVIGKDT